ncbi:hypothetical protein [Algoriphagus formosus]|uniref:hypothetical protein n=1 Tax=Algoriphagus formosus TaxID=2007308 RepID=UPI001F105DE8|nr:hypothetical protein [Algoriphagus aquimaris]
MKKLLLSIMIIGLGFACSDPEPDTYTGKVAEYELYKSSDFDFNGTLTVKELVGGKLELSIILDGANSNSNVSYPAHLHFGNYQLQDAPIAFVLNSVPANSLQSVTVLEQLSDGSRLSFEDFALFDGHVKIHLANDGPDYEVILVAGDIGLAAEQSVFDPSKMAVCGKDF